MSLRTPVALLIFNRPQPTARVFEAIAQAKPQQLLVVADGPRTPGEADLCRQTRSVIDQIDWDCELLTNYSEHNLGCRNRVASGLDWVFSETEEAIILEDDCIPSPSFFSFCEVLLERYRHDERIMHISGDNFQFGKQRTRHSYYFSKYNHIWGWASWRRAWKLYDVTMKTWPEYRDEGLLTAVCENPQERTYWTQAFDRVYNNQIDTWDYQWTYTCWANHGLSVLPNVNLVTNVGFGPDATHTKQAGIVSNLVQEDIWEIHHPPVVVRHAEADTYTFETIFECPTPEPPAPPPVEQPELAAELAATKATLEEKLAVLKQVRKRLRQTRSELETAQAELEAMRSSRFGKLRSRYLTLKDKLPKRSAFKLAIAPPSFNVRTTVANLSNHFSTTPSPRERFKQNARTANLAKHSEVKSPLTGSHEVTLLEVMPADVLIRDWKNGLGIDINPELRGCSEVYLYRCNQTKLNFFVPFGIAGSSALYEQLDRFDWYYMADKWEYEVALEDLVGCHRVIEVGSGFGFFIKKAIAAGLSITGLELNTDAVALAQQQHLPIEPTALETIAEAQPDVFDAVCSFQVLEHVTDPRQFLASSVKLLKQGGKLILCVPNSESFLKHEYCLLDMPPHHMHQWSAATFKSLENLFPLKLERVQYEPLAEHHIPGLLASYRDYFCSVSPLGKVIFNKQTLPVYETLLKRIFRRFFVGQSLYIQFRKT